MLVCPMCKCPVAPRRRSRSDRNLDPRHGIVCTIGGVGAYIYSGHQAAAAAAAATATATSVFLVAATDGRQKWAPVEDKAAGAGTPLHRAELVAPRLPEQRSCN